jgi:hypothetical protein
VVKGSCARCHRDQENSLGGEGGGGRGSEWCDRSGVEGGKGEGSSVEGGKGEFSDGCHGSATMDLVRKVGRVTYPVLKGARATSPVGAMDPGRSGEIGVGEGGVGVKTKTSPSARGLRRGRRYNRDKTTGEGTLRLIRHQTKTCDEVIPPCGLVQHRGPRVIRPIVTGPAWPLHVTGLICKGIPVITVSNPALWEYSGDNLCV